MELTEALYTTRAMRRVAGRLRMEVAQYNELVAFAQFGTADLDRATRMQIEKGQRITEVLKQGQYQPLPLDKQVAILYAVVNDHLNDLSIPAVAEFERGFFTFLDSNYPQVGQQILETGDLADDTEEALKQAIQNFKATFQAASETGGSPATRTQPPRPARSVVHSARATTSDLLKPDELGVGPPDTGLAIG